MELEVETNEAYVLCGTHVGAVVVRRMYGLNALVCPHALGVVTWNVLVPTKLYIGVGTWNVLVPTKLYIGVGTWKVLLVAHTCYWCSRSATPVSCYSPVYIIHT